MRVGLVKRLKADGMIMYRIFHALIKQEWLNRYVIKDTRNAHELVFEYIKTFYNTVRIHEYCGIMLSYDFEEALIS